MKITKHILLLFSFLCMGYAYAQQDAIQRIQFKDVIAKKEGQALKIEMTLDLSKLQVENNRQIQLIPVLVSQDGVTRWELPYLLVQGKTRNKVSIRNERLNNRSQTDKNARHIIRRDNKTRQTISYVAGLPLQQEMKKASLKVYAKVSGCAQCDIAESHRTLMDRLLPEDFVPVYKLTYIVPEAEPVKARSEKYAAHFNYKVGRHELLHDYMDNAKEFAQVDRVINEIRNNKDLTITDLTISGYASPEGSAKSNLLLSQRRAEAFADYLKSTYGMERDKFKVAWYGEDWKGVEQAVATSSLDDKASIIHIIREVNNPDARDARLKKLSSGKTYRRLLEEIYPALRRNEYTIAYVARAFDVEEAKEVIKTKPRLLSLNEMYLVAQTYSSDSKEFKEVFDIAARMYPDEPIAAVNSAAADIEGGNHKAAVERLKKIENNPRVWNNMGVAYAREGDTRNAMKYLRKAAENGDADAKNNMEQLQKYLDDISH